MERTWPCPDCWLVLVKSGPVVRIGPREVDVSDPKAAQTIHNIMDGFAKAPWYRDSVVGDTPNVFQTIDPQAHARRWRILSQPLSEIGLRSVLPVIDERVQLAIAKMAGEMKKKGFVDVYKWCHLMTTDIIGLLSFGEAFGMLEDGEVRLPARPHYAPVRTRRKTDFLL